MPSAFRPTAPGGSDTQVQFNDGGVFGGDSGFVYNKATDVLTLAGAHGALTLTPQADLSGGGYQWMQLAPVSAPSNFNFNVGDFANAGDGARPNRVMMCGWNLGPGGGPVTVGETASGISFESYYAPDAQRYMETHLLYINAAGTQHRPLSITMNRATDYISQLWHANNFIFFNGTETAQCGNFQNGELTLLPIRTAGVPTDGITIGGSGATVSLTAQGAVSKSLSLSGWSSLGLGGITLYPSGTLVAAGNLYMGGDLTSANGTDGKAVLKSDGGTGTAGYLQIETASQIRGLIGKSSTNLTVELRNNSDFVVTENGVRDHLKVTHGTGVLSVLGANNTVALQGSTTGNPVTLTASGSDEQVDIDLEPKGTYGAFTLSTAGGWNNAGGYNGQDPNGVYLSINTDPTHGGMAAFGYSDGSIAAFSLGAISTTDPPTAPLIRFTAPAGFTNSGMAGGVILGIDNDYAHDARPYWMLGVTEKHGTNVAGYPDSVAFVGVNAPDIPDAVLHVRNPTTVNDDAPKNYVLSLFEGRADQVADLVQWKLTGGSALAKITKEGIFNSASFTASLMVATDASKNLVSVAKQTKASHNNWSSLADVVSALVNLGLLDQV